jgi:hypothetical protein
LEKFRAVIRCRPHGFFPKTFSLKKLRTVVRNRFPSFSRERGSVLLVDEVDHLEQKVSQRNVKDVFRLGETQSQL